MTLGRRLRRVLFGKPRDLRDSSLFHRLSLIPFLAWVGLGADGLSSSAYGPEAAFLALVYVATNRLSFPAVGFALLVLTLLVWPQGIFGRSRSV